MYYAITYNDEYFSITNDCKQRILNSSNHLLVIDNPGITVYKIKYLIRVTNTAKLFK